MNLGPHASFIIAAYTVAVLVVGALIAWIELDYGAQRRQLRKLQAQGMTRRSEQSA
jgi:heme exporter protein D